MSARELSELLAAGRAWAADDPDPVTRAEVEHLCAAAESGDADAAIELADAMAGMLEFGTAGLRGRLETLPRSSWVRAGGRPCCPGRCRRRCWPTPFATSEPMPA